MINSLIVGNFHSSIFEICLSRSITICSSNGPLWSLYWSYSYCAPCERVWIREGNRSDVPLTQPGNGPEGTAAWGMSASRRKAHFELWVIGRAALSDQGPGHKGPGTIQVRRTPEVTAMSRNLTHRPKRRANTRTWEQGITQRMDELQGGREARTMLSEKWRSESYLNCENNWLSRAIRVILQTGRGQAFRFFK